jgi:hypothetical protein
MWANVCSQVHGDSTGVLGVEWGVCVEIARWLVGARERQVTARGAAKSTRWCSVAWQSTGRNFDNKTRGGVRLVAKKVDNNSATWTPLASAFSFSRLCGNFWLCAPHGNVIFWHFASKRLAFKGLQRTRRFLCQLEKKRPTLSFFTLLMRVSTPWNACGKSKSALSIYVLGGCLWNNLPICFFHVCARPKGCSHPTKETAPFWSDCNPCWMRRNFHFSVSMMLTGFYCDFHFDTYLCTCNKSFWGMQHAWQTWLARCLLLLRVILHCKYAGATFLLWWEIKKSSLYSRQSFKMLFSPYSKLI